MDLNIFYNNIVKDNKRISDIDTLQFEQLVKIAKSKNFLKYLFKYENVDFFVPNFMAFPRPFLTAIICRLMSKHRCRWINSNGDIQIIGLRKIALEFYIFCKEHLTYKKALTNIDRELSQLLDVPIKKHYLNDLLTPIYLRCDFSYGYVAGGSLGHIAGVLNNLDKHFSKTPLFLTTDQIPTVRDDVKKEIIFGNVQFRNVRDIASIFFSNVFYNVAINKLLNTEIAMIYQRSALNSYAGVKLAQHFDVPLVLEYNGSEVWASKHWGSRVLKATYISEKIEMLTFKKSDLIVCVSKPLRNELIAFGIEEDKILVNPNGVNENVYYPEIDGKPVRNLYNITPQDIVVGFIGTFGAWHGAEVLAQAFTELKKTTLNKNIKLMLIGDGMLMPQINKILSDAALLDSCIFCGIIPQQKGAQYLAACDILVSPQIKNPDGTPFFGSPTKIFEYMAMGKAIVASELDQIAEILENGKTALLCEPGNSHQLAAAIEKLAGDDSLRKLLGANARQTVCKYYTWEKHTSRIMEKLKLRLSRVS